MATIHLARLHGPQGFTRTVAAKQLHPQFAQNPQFVAMFLDEARLAVRIRHGNVLSPLDVVVTDSELFIIMDYVNGESLAALLRAQLGPLPLPIASAILVQVLLGLHAVHEAKRERGEPLDLVHRDASPHNILVGEDGVARVIDFGIAKATSRSQITEEGKLKGKIGYMAPEQLRQEPVDRRTDLFTTGIVLWEVLTGIRLFGADTLAASVELILHGRVDPPSNRNPAVGGDLDALVLRALAPEPSARWPDAKSMAVALERAVTPASTLELVRWVEELAGPELARKAELVKRAEAILLEEPDDPIVDVSASAIEIPSPSPAVSGNTSEMTSVSLGRETQAPISAARKRWRVGLVLGPVLAGALALTLLPRLHGGLAAQPTSRPPRDTRLEKQPAPAAPIRPEPTGARVVPRTPEPEVLSSAPRSSAPAIQAPAIRAPVARLTPAPTQSALATIKRDNCNPPWTLTKENVKIFKADCLR